MEPQIVDYYRSKNNCANKEPVVIYKDEDELDRLKIEAYGEFYSDLQNLILDVDIRHSDFMFIMENLLHKMLKDKEREISWVYGKSGEIQDFIVATIEPLSSNGYLDYDIIYNIIKNYIDKMFDPEESYGIVKFKCCSCNELDDYLVDGGCYDCRHSDNDSFEEDYDY
jgi:hypothetical protein